MYVLHFGEQDIIKYSYSKRTEVRTSFFVYLLGDIMRIKSKLNKLHRGCKNVNLKYLVALTDLTSGITVQ